MRPHLYSQTSTTFLRTPQATNKLSTLNTDSSQFILVTDG
jgi:hypothetical protein